LIPIEIFEYKQKWKPGYVVRLHSDLRSQGKEYCKVQLFKQQWDVNEFTDVYEDTYYFEHKMDALSFAAQWPEYVNQ
jgi:hypothetical protein|tara:strand:+ start:1763 stop:1993 length:231 start_codon:yes stop_codon:yes gene_type:complete